MRHLLVLDGWQFNRAPGHWQAWLAQRHVDLGGTAEYLVLPEPERPSWERWSRAIAEAASARPGTLVVAHGLTALAWLRLAEYGERSTPLAERALLVAPPAPGAHGGDVSRLPEATPAAVRSLTRAPSLLVATDDDPFCPAGADTLYGGLGLDSVVVPGGAHLNEKSGHAELPQALRWVLGEGWGDADPDAAHLLRDRYRPEGRRLGALLAGELPAGVVAAAEQLLIEAGHTPERRLARLQPRHGESAVRPVELADYLARYGHEYQLAVIDERLAPDAAARAALTATAEAAGVALLWSDTPSGALIPA